jgi:hypothetical protein
MDAYFCYIHRPSRSVAELKILNCETEASLERQLARLMADYPDARLEIFHGETLIGERRSGDGTAPVRGDADDAGRPVVSAGKD